MKKFIVIYHAPVDAMKRTAEVSAEDQAKGMEAWMQWSQRCGEKLVDLGAPLMNGQQLNPNGSVAPSSKMVSGYSILQAESMEDAKSLLTNHPHLQWNADCVIEVHETMALPGME